MINHSINDIRDIVDEIWKKTSPDVSVHASENYVRITLTASYERPDATFKQLKALSEIFDTLSINVENGEDSAGCDTCDYGSHYELVITITPDEAKRTIKRKVAKSEHLPTG